MKKRFFGIGVALAALLATVWLAGCPTEPGDEKKKEDTNKSGATLEWATIGTVEASYPTEFKTTAAAVLADDYEASEISLTNSQTSAAISVGLISTNPNATVAFAVLVKANQTNPTLSDSDFATLTSGTTTVTGGFNDEDWLVLKVTSEDGTNTRYYRFNITLGRNANLASVAIGGILGKEKTQITEAYLGKPGAAFGDITIGTFQTEHIYPASVFIATPEDDEATVEYAFVQSVPTDLTAVLTTYSSSVALSGITLDSEVTHLIVKVTPTSASGTALYYITKLILPRRGLIKYGVPELVNSAAPESAFYIDPIWDTAEEFIIDRANNAEGMPASFEANPHTSAKAKALWDDNGIWVLIDVTVKTTPTVTSRPITPSGDHTGDSVEIFINERLQRLGTTASRDWGNQFRLGVAGARTGETGAAGNTEGGTEAKSGLAPFDDSTYAQFRTVLKKTGYTTDITSSTTVADYAVGQLSEATNGGYLAIAYVPFKYKSSANADEVFSSNSVIDDALIGFELQLNCNSGSGRDGILTWNGYQSMAYQNAEGYGLVNLDRDSKPADTKVFPTITAQSLSDGQYVVNTTGAVDALSVTTTGTVQWYVASSPYGAGTAVASTTNANHTPDITTEGTFYYYAVVTASSVSVVTNKRAKIEVGDEDSFAKPPARIEPFAEHVANVGTTVPVYAFDLGDNRFDVFTKITFKAKLDTASASIEGRLRAWGSYGDGSTAWTNKSIGIGNGTGAGQKLLNSAGMANIPTDWAEETITFDSATPNTEQAALKGVILLGVGYAPGGGQNDARSYYISDIVLSNADGSITAPAIHPESLTLTNMKTAYITGDNGQATYESVRTLIPFTEHVANVGTTVPVYAFDLGDNRFDVFTKITFKAKLDTASASIEGRLRAWGSYGDGSTAWVNKSIGIGNGTGGGQKLLNSAGMANIPTDWAEQTITFDSATPNTEQAALKGVILLGIGYAPGGGQNDARSYYISDIVLSNADGTVTASAFHPGNSSPLVGSLSSAYITGDNGQATYESVRTIKAWGWLTD